jgi:hypothetical protein
MDQERAVGLEHEQPNGLGQTGRQAACIEDFAAGDDEAHSPRTVLSVSDGSSRRCGALSIRSCCSDRSNFGEPLDCELVGPAGVPTDRGFPCGPCLRSSVVRVVVETGGVVW